MTFSRKATAVGLALIFVAAASLTTTIVAAPSAVASPPWTCSSGYVCLFDGTNGVEDRPTAAVGRNRDTNLATWNPPLNDLANSAWNRTGCTVRLYSYAGNGNWGLVATLQPAFKANLQPEDRNRVDRVVTC